jgi:glycosyltransferase involved in cell wall biosynthesis
MYVERPGIALIGARGIPPRFGGCDAVADGLSEKLTEMGFEVYVTCNSRRCYTDKYNKVIRIHTPSIEGKTLTVPTINEVFHTFHLLVKYPKVRVIYYMLSYGALVAIIPKLLGKKIIICTDGIEWKRPLTRRPYFSAGWKLVAVLTSWHLRFMEWLSIKVANVIIADSRVIKTYLEEKYKAKNVVYISYGARDLLNPDITPGEETEILHSYGLSAEEYYLTVTRLVADNNIHLEIEGFRRSESKKKLVIVGKLNQEDGYTKYLIKLSGNDSNIVFLDAIFDTVKQGVLRKNCFGYIHAYQAGGTNPTLLEQMLFKKPILALDIGFQREVLQGGGIYFKDADDLARGIGMLEKGEVDRESMAAWQARRMKEEYNWDYVAEKYSTLFKNLLGHEIENIVNPM